MFKKLFNKLFGKGDEVKETKNSTVKSSPKVDTSSKKKVVSDGKRVEGQVKFLNKKNGYGFIKSSQTEQDVFVHFDDTKDFLKRGDKVSFEVEKSEKGLRARNVKVVK